MRRILAAAAGLITAAVAVLVVGISIAPPASAHAFLVASNPADGSTVSAPPRVLKLDFSESVVVEATHVQLVDSAGQRIAPEAIHLIGKASDDTEDPASLAVLLPRLPRSAYTVSWRTLSSDDLHSTQGVFVFGVGEAVHAAPFHEPAPRLDEAALRWAVFVCLALALGAALWGRMAEQAGARGRDRRRDERDVRRLGRAGAILGLVTAGVLLAQQLAASGTDLAAVVDSGYGLRWAIRAIGFVLLAVALSPRVDGRRALSRSLIALGAGAACVGSALLGHSATGGLTRTVADALHLAAAATWAGVLLVASLVWLTGRRHVAAVLRTFRGPALVSVGVLVVTGVYLASGVVGSVDAALLTAYGRVLLLKLAAVVAIMVFGLVNTRRLHAARRGARSVRGTVLAETGLAVLALALAAVLTSGQPAMERRFVSTAQPHVQAIQSIGIADLQESLSVRPNRPGRNAAIVDVFDTRRPAPAPITAVLVRAGGGYLAATPLGDGHWSVPIDLDRPGRVQLTVRVQRPGITTDHAYAWVVGGGSVGTRPATVSTAPLAGALTATAGTLAAIFVLAAGATVLASRRRRPASEVGELTAVPVDSG
jgi:copper transport protein